MLCRGGNDLQKRPHEGPRAGDGNSRGYAYSEIKRMIRLRLPVRNRLRQSQSWQSMILRSSSTWPQCNCASFRKDQKWPLIVKRKLFRIALWKNALKEIFVLPGKYGQHRRFKSLDGTL